MDNASVIAVFNRFAGKEIQVIENPKALNVGKETYTLIDVRPAKSEPTLKEMKKTAKDNGLSLRVFFPGTAGMMDYNRKDRVNVYVGRAPDGKYRVASAWLG